MAKPTNQYLNDCLKFSEKFLKYSFPFFDKVLRYIMINIINNTNVKFIESDIFSNVSDKYDVIISNPPYISYDDIEVMDIVKNNEPHLALYAKDNGLYFYDKIIKDSSKYLNDKFIMAFEIGYKQGKDITKIVNKYYKDINMSVEKDYSGRDRFVFIWNH